MLDINKKTFHTHPSLLPLRMALLVAESDAPCRPPRTDANEQCALQLITNMQADYKKPASLFNWADIPSPYVIHENFQEMAVTNA